jgi:iron complex transport system ATP-binding protein
MRPAELSRRRAVVPQATALSSPFTALEVVMLGVTVPGFGLATDAAPGLAALGAVGLAGFERRLYTELSGGERQRVHIARAFSQLAAAPDVEPGDSVLLLDEPTASLDPAHQVLVLRALRAHAELGRTVIAVMHDLNLASAWGDHVVMMRDGRVQASGPIDGLFRGEILSHVYDCDMRSNMVPVDGRPFVLPHHTALRRPHSSGATPPGAVGAAGTA